MTTSLPAAIRVCTAYFYGAVLISLFVFGTLSAPLANAQSSAYESASVETGQAKSRLIVEKNGIAPGETVWLALEQTLSPKWHVYWKNPGDSGLPLTMSFTLPEGFKAGETSYPAPERLPVGPLVNFGFEGVPYFLVPISAPANAPIGEDLEIALRAEWLICNDVCIPEEGDFSLSLPIIARTQTAESFKPLFETARAALPLPSNGLAVFGPLGSIKSGEAQSVEKVGFATSAPDVNLDLSRLTEAFLFVDEETLFSPSTDQNFSVQDTNIFLSLTPDFGLDLDKQKTLSGVLSLTFENGDHLTYEVNAAKESADVIAGLAGESAQAFSAISQNGGAQNVGVNSNIPLLLLMAFLGGIILNVMPCVFPILFIKASSLMTSAQEDRATIRLHGWIYTIGVMATFALIGAILLILRAQGQKLGWGFHLQSPPIVLLSSYVLLLVGLNLAGVFHVGTSVQGLGQGLTTKQGAVGSFFTGALAVVVAAPCIGPLLSAPMGAAVLLPPIWGMLIFVLMAFGLAFPYLLLSLVPGLGKALPRPGAWMDTFKQALSFPVFAAAAYFLWVASAQTGNTGLGIGLLGALFLSAAAWLFEAGKSGNKLGIVAKGLAVLLVIGALLPLRSVKPIEAISIAEGGKAGHGALEAQAFDLQEIASLNAAGQDVFVDFTAAWCVTCQFNKRTVFSSDDVAQAFDKSDTLLMVADWTVRDPKITAALQGFGRSGVPLYVYYPANGEPEILNLPLTKGAIVKTLSGT